MRNNAAYLPENPIVYIIFPESIHNRASFVIFAAYTRIWNNPVLPIALQTSFGDIQSQTDLLGIQSLFHFNRTNFLFNGFNLGG